MSDEDDDKLIIASRPATKKTRTRTRNANNRSQSTQKARNPDQQKLNSNKEENHEKPQKQNELKVSNDPKQENDNENISTDSEEDYESSEYYYTSYYEETVSESAKNPVSSIIDTTLPNFSSIPCTGSFFISRVKKPHMKSRRDYQIISNEKCIMCAKECGVFSPDAILNEGQEVHIKSAQYKYKIQNISKSKNFQILDGNEVVGFIKYVNDYEGNIGPRKIDLKFGETEYLSRIPTISKDGRFCLKFDGHYTLASCRNAILIDSKEHKVLTIRKVSKNHLELSVFQPLPLFIIAFVGITSYIYRG